MKEKEKLRETVTPASRTAALPLFPSDIQRLTDVKGCPINSPLKLNTPRSFKKAVRNFKGVRSRM